MQAANSKISPLLPPSTTPASIPRAAPSLLPSQPVYDGRRGHQHAHRLSPTLPAPTRPLPTTHNPRAPTLRPRAANGRRALPPPADALAHGREQPALALPGVPVLLCGCARGHPADGLGADAPQLACVLFLLVNARAANVLVCDSGPSQLPVLPTPPRARVDRRARSSESRPFSFQQAL